MITIDWSDEDEAYLAKSDMPKCMAHGNTETEALEQLLIAVDNWWESASDEAFEELLEYIRTGKLRNGIVPRPQKGYSPLAHLWFQAFPYYIGRYISDAG